MMNYPLSLFVGLRYTLTRRQNKSVSFISAIAMIGIILGVALLITVLAVMNGFEKELKERILTIMPQVTVYQSGGLKNWEERRSELLTSERIVGASPFVELRGMLHEGKYTKPALIYGLDHRYESSVSQISQYLNDDVLLQLNQQADSIALGIGLAKKLNIVEGDSLTIIIPRENDSSISPAFKRFMVIDVFKTATELDHNLVLMGLNQASTLHSSLDDSFITGIHLRVDDLFAAPRIAAELRTQLPYGFYTSDWTRTHGNIYHAINMSKNLVGILLFLIIAIAAFNVVSTLVMVVVDKQTDIAIFRTMGMSDKQILAIFMVQGSIIGIIGTLIGIVVGVSFALSIEYIVASIESALSVSFLDSEIYPISFLPSELNIGDVVLISSVALLMSMLATIYPAIKAVRVEPAQALRYD